MIIYAVKSRIPSVLAAKEPVILVAHSLGRLLVAHWAARGFAQDQASSPVAGAFLVSPPDPDGLNFPADAASFRAPPRARLPFPSLVVASLDDSYAGLDVMRAHAVNWKSGFVVAGALGHINEASALGDWAQGRALLEAFRAGLGKLFG